MSGATIKLSGVLTAHGEQIESIDLVEPTGDDIMELGYPFLIHGGGAIELRPKVVGQYVVRLGKVPLSTVKKLSLSDLQACTAAVLGFFGRSESGEEEGAKPTAAQASST